MAGETVITVIGNLTDDADLRFLPNGTAVSSFTIASTARIFDRQANEWKDAPTLFLRSQVFKDQAEHAAETLKRGMRVIAQGRLQQRSYEDREGQKRTVYELSVDEVGPSLKSATAVVTKTTGGGQGARQQPAQQQGSGWGGQQAAGDPWAAPQQDGSGVPF